LTHISSSQSAFQSALPTDRAATATAAYLLVAHGSRDPRHAPALRQLAEAVAVRWRAAPQTKGAEILVGTAFLEVQETPLHQQIQAFAEQAIAQQCHTLHLLPLFLLPGVHVMEDIPAEVAIAQSTLDPSFSIHIAPYLGQAPDLAVALAPHLPPTQESAATAILLAHGSRRPGGNAPILALAAALKLSLAYWSIEPSLEVQIETLILQGYTDIAVVPYVLFPGGITDAIAQRLATLTQQHPQIRFWQTDPLNNLVPLAQWIVDWMVLG